ncbi:MAG: hypothetical protein RL758_1390, partial [Pseudomonadota bacterium]
WDRSVRRRCEGRKMRENKAQIVENRVKETGDFMM